MANKGDVTLRVVNKEDFDVVRGGYLFPAKGDAQQQHDAAVEAGEAEGEYNGREVTTQAHRVREITACRYLDSTILGVEGAQGNERVEAFAKAVQSTPGSEDTKLELPPEDELTLAEKNNYANATAGAKELASEYELDLADVPTNDANGRVDKADVQAHLEQRTSSGSITEGQADQGGAPNAPGQVVTEAGTGGEQVHDDGGEEAAEEVQ